jgi:hypothetical protein
MSSLEAEGKQVAHACVDLSWHYTDSLQLIN